MKTFKVLFIVVVAVSFIKCTGSKYTIQNKGDTAQIDIVNPNSSLIRAFHTEVEIVIVTDTSIIALQYNDNIPTESQFGKVIEIPFNNIKQIEILGYSNNRWILPVILFQVVPAIILTITGITASSENAIIIAPLLIPAMLTSLLFAVSDTEAPSFKGTNLFQEKEKLKLYAKFPNGLSPENFIRFLSLHGQEEPELLFK